MQGKFPNHTHIPSLSQPTHRLFQTGQCYFYYKPEGRSPSNGLAYYIPSGCENLATTKKCEPCVAVLSRLVDTLEMADDMAIDIPHIWLYLAELLSPLLKEGGIPMRELFR